jgi:mRNA-degrading endonuclease RelE of RelBE toxin-antitoxin system
LINIRLLPSAQRDLQRLPERVQIVVLNALGTRVRENALRMSKPLLGALEGKRSVRLGDYRMIISLPEPDLILVHYVQHRSTVYRQGRRY